MFGSSRQLAVGPVAVTSLLIGSGLKKVVPGAQFVTDPNNLDTYQYDVQQRYNRSVTQLAFLVAVMYTAMGALRLGFLLRLLSHPIITGFTSGAAITIAVGQVCVCVYVLVVGVKGGCVRACIVSCAALSCCVADAQKRAAPQPAVGRPPSSNAPHTQPTAAAPTTTTHTRAHAHKHANTNTHKKTSCTTSSATRCRAATRCTSRSAC